MLAASPRQVATFWAHPRHLQSPQREKCLGWAVKHVLREIPEAVMCRCWLTWAGLHHSGHATITLPSCCGEEHKCRASKKKGAKSRRPQGWLGCIGSLAALPLLSRHKMASYR